MKVIQDFVIQDMGHPIKYVASMLHFQLMILDNNHPIRKDILKMIYLKNYKFIMFKKLFTPLTQQQLFQMPGSVGMIVNEHNMRGSPTSHP